MLLIIFLGLIAKLTYSFRWMRLWNSEYGRFWLHKGRC